MTTSLPRGLYELLVTELVDEQLRSQQAQGTPDVDEIRGAEVADRIALHVARVVEIAIDGAPEEHRVDVGAALCRRLIEQAVALAGENGLARLQLAQPAKVLRAIRRQLPDGQLEVISKPLIPLLDTTLLTNAPGEPRVGHQIEAEIASADRLTSSWPLSG
jgi:hypothetical protein